MTTSGLVAIHCQPLQTEKLRWTEKCGMDKTMGKDNNVLILIELHAARRTQ